MASYWTQEVGAVQSRHPRWEAMFHSLPDILNGILIILTNDWFCCVSRKSTFLLPLWDLVWHKIHILVNDYTAECLVAG